MTERLYLYPQTSCDCLKDIKPDFPDGAPSNLPVANCKIPAYFKTHDRYKLSDNTELDERGKINLNKQVYTQKYSKSFKETDKVCDNNIQYSSRDPRTYDWSRSQWTTLNSPPIDGNVKLKDVYNNNLKDYGQKYTGYADINAGQINYYIDKQIAEPYFNPLFAFPSSYQKVIYKDPMDNLKAEYPRTVPYRNPMVKECADLGHENKKVCLSWINDSNQFREDLLTAQMAKMNQSKYSARW